MNSLSLRAPTQTFQALGFEIDLSKSRIGTLSLPTGRLVVCDPLSMPETEPYLTEFPKGEFPIFGLAAAMRDGSELAFVTVDLDSERDPVKWTIALTPEEEEEDWGEPQTFPVDTYVAAMMDEHAASALLDFDRFDDLEEDFERQLSGEFRKTKRDVVPTATVEIIGAPIFAFRAKPKNYSVYIGWSEKGDPVQVVVDLKEIDARFSPSGIRF